MIIAIDGPAGAGKSTVARALAGRLGFLYIDSGAMYRAVAVLAARAGVALDDEPALGELAGGLRSEFRGDPPRLWVNGEDLEPALRTAEAGEGASRVAALSAVRQAMVAAQQALGAAASPGGGVVMEGRDIGSVVFPQAELKIYLDASLAERARRRLEDLRQRGEAADSEQVRREVAARDQRDRTRDVSPLQRTEDAVVVMTDGLTPEQVVERLAELARERGA